VTRCETAADVEREALLGRWIALPRALTDSHAEDMAHKTGRPEHPVHRWAREIFGSGPSMKRGAEDDR
jgi:hypothetical protein